MKVVLLLIASILCICAAQDFDASYDVSYDVSSNETETATYNHGDGKPGCQSRVEFERRWRNNWDPKRYWVCTEKGAVSYVCGTELMYQDSRQCCVHWSYWVWTAPFDPITFG